MLFNSYIFIFIFLPITFFIYFHLNQKRLTELSKGFLVACSLFFYSWWNIIYLPLILCSLTFNFMIGWQLSKDTARNRFFSKKVILILAVSVNILLLGYFKYTDFLIVNCNKIIDADLPVLNLALPLAISFYTFQQIAYLVDSYRGETKEYDFLNYAVFVTFFPQLIAGPIVHHSEMMPQFKNIRHKIINYKNITVGVLLFSIGVFKKVIIADTFAVWATKGFDVTPQLNFFEAWTTSLSYTFQLYFDFSGYTDMAVGAALLFNIRLPVNFNSPYKALSIHDFWRRWHITLSNFLRDYIYFPLGGNRKGNLQTYNNILVTFLLGGLWHGAGWTFVFWGFLHGMALIVHRVWKSFDLKMNVILAWLITFNFINIAWIFFRAKTFEDAVKVLKGMLTVDSSTFTLLKAKVLFFINPGMNIAVWIKRIVDQTDIFSWLILSLLIVIIAKNSVELVESYHKKKTFIVYVSILLSISLINFSKVTEFIYFNF